MYEYTILAKTSKSVKGIESFFIREIIFLKFQ